MNCKSKPFGALARENRETAQGLIKILFVRFAEFMSMKHSLTEEHIDFITDTILNDYPHLTCADLVYILKEAKCGKHGNLYERLSTQQIFRWIDDYMDRRIEIAERNSIAESQKYK